MNIKKFDVIIFGASGCIGKNTVLHAREVLKLCHWAIAGKCERKLQAVLNEITLKTGKVLNVPIFQANSHDLESLAVVVEKCKVLINCCGPYQFLAENILTTCIIKGTHYVDMCNDPYFNELMELKYHEKALQHEVFIISSCGFHSFPIEVALNFLRQNFKGTINSVEAFVRYNFGYYFYFPLHSIFTSTAWSSLILSRWKIGDLSTIRDELRQEELPYLQPELQIRELSQRSQYHEEGVMVHMPFLDQQAIDRSQYMFYARDNQRPLQFCKYIEFPSYIWAIMFIIWCLIVSILAQFKRTRKLLRNHPNLFSVGMFSSEGPIPYLLEMSSYKIKICAKGWSWSTLYPKFEANNDDSIVDQHLNIEISGENPIYGCGCVCLLISARILLEERDKISERGGVFAPGFVFKNVNILTKFKNLSNYLRVRVL